MKDIVREVSEFDWKNWVPREKAVIVFIRTGDEIVLIEKKTGLGAGKINGPGGRIEPGESPHQCAVRECIEEIGVTPINLSLRAELSFVFTYGYSLYGYAFIADNFEGTLIETDEAKPFLCPEKSIPYGKMWADDILWLPHALAGKFVNARFIFDSDTMLSYDIDIVNIPG